jgi:hypothetical protein
MSKFIVNTIQPRTSETLQIDGNLAISGNLNGVPVTVLTGGTGFTGNTSGDCITQAYIDNIYGVNTDLVNSPNLVVGTNAVVYGNVTANSLYGDGSHLDNLNFPPFTGNTSDECIQNVWVESLYGCNQSISVNDKMYINGGMSAGTFYGDSSYLSTPIYDIIPVGSGVTNVGVYLQYGLNIISTATTSDFCVRFPETPVDGREVKILNTSGFNIIIYPSMSGGTINGVVNGNIIIPSDNKTYIFYCYENPAPGSWAGNFVTSTNQYDSGIISIDTSAGNGFVSAMDNNFKNNTTGFCSANFPAIEALTKSNYTYFSNPQNCDQGVVYFRPTTPWSFIDKITVYTNFTTGVTTSGSFGLVNGFERTYYYQGTITPTGYEGWGGAGNFGSPGYGACDQLMAGTPSSNTYTQNPGDPGTYWGEIVYSAATRPSMIGDFLLSSGTMYLGIPVNANVNADLWLSRAFAFIFDTNQISTDVKFRFIIDYTV